MCDAIKDTEAIYLFLFFARELRSQNLLQDACFEESALPKDSVREDQRQPFEIPGPSPRSTTETEIKVARYSKSWHIVLLSP